MRKLSVRQLFTLLLLAVIAATFTFHFPPYPSPAHLSLHNSTLLTLSAFDPAEDSLRQEIDQLIQGNIENLSRYRSSFLWHHFTVATVIRARTSRSAPISLRFRTLLTDWSRQRRSHRRESVDSVLSDLLHHLGRREKYSSCAVVGNSGILLNARHGAAIDAHEAVIRLNNARISGYSNDVGERATISFVNSNVLYLCARREDCFCHPYGADVPLLHYLCQPIHLLDFAACNATVNRAPLLVTDPKFDILCAKIVEYYLLRRWFGPGGIDRNRTLLGWSVAHRGMLFHYSSGMQAVVMAAGVCERVSMYGFGKAATAKHHYHTNQKAELQLHDYEAEYEFYRDLMEQPQEIPFLSSGEFLFPPFEIHQRKGEPLCSCEIVY